MGLRRLLEVQQRREERAAQRDAWLVTALARAINGSVGYEELLGELLGRARAKELCLGPTVKRWKQRRRAARAE